MHWGREPEVEPASESLDLPSLLGRPKKRNEYTEQRSLNRSESAPVFLLSAHLANLAQQAASTARLPPLSPASAPSAASPKARRPSSSLSGGSPSKTRLEAFHISGTAVRTTRPRACTSQESAEHELDHFLNVVAKKHSRHIAEQIYHEFPVAKRFNEKMQFRARAKQEELDRMAAGGGVRGRNKTARLAKTMKAAASAEGSGQATVNLSPPADCTPESEGV